jgi:hypothetical protein
MVFLAGTCMGFPLNSGSSFDGLAGSISIIKVGKDDRSNKASYILSGKDGRVSGVGVGTKEFELPKAVVSDVL